MPPVPTIWLVSFDSFGNVFPHPLYLHLKAYWWKSGYVLEKGVVRCANRFG